jgi:hypothetical protein
MENLPDTNNNEFGNLLIPSVEHKEPENDDCGLPEDPVFSNYSKYLWKGHSENSRIRKNARLPENNDGYKNPK